MSERDVTATEIKKNFLSEIIESDLASGKIQRLITRFPPEPNGFLHVGHAKAISVNFGLAARFGGQCHLRFDDTNPETEKQVYIDSIQQDIQWLGFDWGQHLFYASSYFERLYNYGVFLIKAGKAFVCSQTVEEIRATRGTLTEAGTPSPDRNRPIDESLDLFARMRAGEFSDGTLTLRAKIDMGDSNMKMRDPLLYRIRHAAHPKTGRDWCIYPMYDFAHCLSDSIEGITHSICTLEFENNRELYDWILEACEVEHVSRQYEMARLQLTYVMTSKRKLKALVDDGHVDGWDDPRMPTIAGLRRRGVPSEAIRNFCDDIGVTKANTTLDMSRFDFHIRQVLNQTAPRVMAVLNPLKVIITNFPDAEESLSLTASYWPHDIPQEGSREVPFTRELYIEREDFSQNPPKGFYRLKPHGEVRLRYGFFIKCDDVITDQNGEIIALHCSYDPETLGGSAPDGRKVKGTIHWVSATKGLPARFNCYEKLFQEESVGARTGAFEDDLTPNSHRIQMGYIEPSVVNDDHSTRYQFERNGYFWREQKEGTEQLVFNEIIGLRDSWSKPSPSATSTVEEGENEQSSGPGNTRASRPTKRTPAQLRDLARRQDPTLMAAYVRYKEEVKLAEIDADILTSSQNLNHLFAESLKSTVEVDLLTKWFTNVLPALLESEERPATTGLDLAHLIELIEAQVVSSTAAKEVASLMLKTGEKANAIIDRLNLTQISDTAVLNETLSKVLAAHPDKVTAIQNGKPQLIGFFIGQMMREMHNANPQIVKKLVHDYFAQNITE